jgi:hypothetical protein
MAPPRTFSYERLRRLIVDHPAWTYAKYADVLTEDERRTNPSAPRVKPSAVRRVVSEYRDEWEEDGTRVPDRRLGHDIRVPLTRVSENYWMATSARHLRELWQERQGNPPIGDHQKYARRQALRWEEALRENRQIVDISGKGEVIVRPAGADELDSHGDLLEIAAWALPGKEAASAPGRRGRG